MTSQFFSLIAESLISISAANNCEKQLTKNYGSTAFSDLEELFHTEDHNFLIEKLNCFDLRDQIGSLIRDILSDRGQLEFSGIRKIIIEEH